MSYLVYYTNEGDDPPENPLVDGAHQERFRRFIEAYGGKLMHVVYRNHEGRAWIYKVQKLHRRARITFRTGDKHVLTVRGTGLPLQVPRHALLPRRQAGSVQDRPGRRVLAEDPAAVLRPGELLPGGDGQLRQLRIDGRPTSRRCATAERAAGDRGAGPPRGGTRSAKPAGRGPAGPQPAEGGARDAQADPGGRLAAGEGARRRSRTASGSCPRRRAISSSRSTRRTARRRCGGGSA